MKRSTVVYVFLLITLLLAAIAIGWLALAPSRFELLVINNSDTPVDSVSLSGDAVVACEPMIVEQLAAGERQALVCQLNREGLLRVNVAQGRNRIDYIVADDVSELSENGKTFTVFSDNRFVLGALPSES